MQTPITNSLNELTSTSTVLETRLKELNKARQMINNIKSVEEFMNFKLKISQSFFDLDQVIRETLQNIKNAELQNKEIANEKEFFSMKMNNLESKILNGENFISELKQNNRELVNQINFQQEKLINNENLIMQMQAKLKIYEGEGTNSIEERNNITNINNNNLLKNNLNHNVNFISLQPKAEKSHLDSINKNIFDQQTKGKNTISIGFSREKEDNFATKDTNENFSKLNFNYNSPCLSQKNDMDSIYNNNKYHDQDQDTINIQERVYLNKIANNNIQNDNTIEAEKVFI